MRRYAAFDPANIGPDLATERGDTIVYCSEDGRDNNRIARSVFGQSKYQSACEFLFWQPQDDIVGDPPPEKDSPSTETLFVGIVTEANPLDRYLGRDSTGYGYDPLSGSVYNDASVIDSWATTALGVIIRVELDCAANICRWYAGPDLLGSVDIPSGETWFYAVTVSGGDAESVKCYANAGQQKFAFTDDTTGGWWYAPTQMAPLKLGTEPYISASTDSPPHERFRKGISRTNGMRNSRAASFWMDGDGDASSSVGSLELIDMEGDVIPALLSNDTQDLPVEVLSVEVGAALSSAITIATGVIESDEVNGDSQATIILRDSMAKFEAAALRRLIPPNAAPSSVDRPWPVLIGAARSIPLTLIDEATFDNAVADQPIGNIGLVRNNGRAVDPADFVLSQNGERLILSADLQGKTTVDASANGQFSPGSYTDMLAGVGDFENDMHSTYGMSVLWTRGGGQLGNSNGVYFPQWSDTGNSIGRAEFAGSANSADAHSWLVTLTDVIQPSRSYRARLYIEYIPGIDEDTGQRGWLTLTGRPSANGPITEWKRWANETPYLNGTLPDAGFFECVFHNAESVALPFAIQAITQVNAKTRVRSVELYELPAAGDDIALEGVSLYEYMRRAIRDLGGLPSSAWRRRDAQAIDTATGYLYGIHITDALTVREVIAPALRSCTASLVARADGSAGVVRLIDPDSVDDADIDFEITPSMLLSEPRIVRDRAPNLTTRAGYRKNYDIASDADFGDDFDPSTGVTMALRRILSQPFQAYVSSGIQLAGCYSHALTADALQTLFDDKADAQAEIDRVCSLYSVVRRLVTLELDWQEHRFESGQVVLFTYPRFGYDAGKKFFVRSVEDAALESVTLELWG